MVKAMGAAATSKGSNRDMRDLLSGRQARSRILCLTVTSPNRRTSKLDSDIVRRKRFDCWGHVVDLHGKVTPVFALKSDPPGWPDYGSGFGLFLILVSLSLLMVEFLS